MNVQRSPAGVPYLYRGGAEPPSRLCIHIGGNTQSNPNTAGALCGALACSAGNWAVYAVLNDAAKQAKPLHTVRAWMPSATSDGKLGGFVQWVVDRHRLAPHTCVHLSGLSNGGICVLDFAAARPQLVASLTAFPGKSSEPSVPKLRRKLAALAASGCPVHLAVGSRDSGFLPDARGVAQALTEARSGGEASGVTLEILDGWGHQLHGDSDDAKGDARGVEGAPYPFSPARFVEIMSSHAAVAEAAAARLSDGGVSASVGAARGGGGGDDATIESPSAASGSAEAAASGSCFANTVPRL